MEQDTTAKEDDRACNLRTERIHNALQILALVPDLPSPTPALAGAVYDGLRKLEDNNKLWTLDPWGLVLQEQLAFAIMVPGGRADRAAAAVKLMRDNKILPVRRNQIFLPGAAELLLVIEKLVRFPQQKAERLAKALANWKTLVQLGQAPLLLTTLKHKLWMQNVDGFGPKAAAHFMRNTGLQSMSTDPIPIIDTHIRKLLLALGVVAAGAKQSVCAEAFNNVCMQNRAPMLLVDALAWCAYSGTTDPSSIDFGNFS